MERMALLVPAVVFYTLGTAIAVGVLVEILVSVVQSAGNRKTRDEPHGKAQEGT